MLRKVIACALLTGCAPHIVGMTEAGGIVSGADWRSGKALQVANAECAKFGKSARISSQANLDGNMTFDCVTTTR
jgi:hypothetical protein